MTGQPRVNLDWRGVRDYEAQQLRVTTLQGLVRQLRGENRMLLRENRRLRAALTEVRARSVRGSSRLPVGFNDARRS